MTEVEVTKELAAKWPSLSPRARRKSKLKARYGERLVEAIANTQEKLDLLNELAAETTPAQDPEGR